ncbi:MAG: family 16 glycosylhydrolase [Acidimicrobiales bacterium]
MSALLVVGAIAVPSVASSDESTPYPIGVVSSSEPSGYAPPSADAMPGYSLTYVNDFTGTTVPAGWGVFTGTPSGDPGSQWESSQVVVSGGMLQLNAAQDPALNNEWITGGLCQCGQSQTYGAYFVRSRETGPGPTIVELLWPTQGWPPEIDFIETGGVTTDATATNIWGLDSSGNKEQQQDAITIDMTQWHTWGVVWTPTSITYTVDGQAWGTFTDPSEIPSQPMSLHIQQQTWCSAGFACPTSPESTDVDWVAEYSPNSSSPPTTTPVVSSPPPPAPPVATPPAAPTTTTTTTSPESHSPSSDLIRLSSFASNSSTLSNTLKIKIAHLATKIEDNLDDVVTLTGYSSDSLGRTVALALARARVQKVASFLRSRLTQLDDPRVTILTRTAISPGATLTAQLMSRSVVALVR